MEPLEDRSLLAANPLISEFLAVNRSGLQDEDGAYSDWIELHNPTDASIDLQGWSVTDDQDVPKKWTFPGITLPPRAYRVVFASGKDRREPTGSLHTNFQLSAEGEYLALVSPQGAVVQDFGKSYPAQRADISYGATAAMVRTPLRSADEELRAIVPTDDRYGNAWVRPDFNDDHWLRGPRGVGYDLDGLDASEIGIDVRSTLFGQNPSALVRVPFQVDPARLASLDELTMPLKYDDGFAAWLNGQPLTSRNAPGGGLSPPQGLVAYYPFDDSAQDTAGLFTQNSGATANDLSLASGTAPRWVPGRVGQALALNAQANDVTRLTAPAQADLDLGGQFTLEAWIYPTQLNAWNRLLLEWDGSGKNSVFFSLRNGSQLSVFHVDAKGVQQNVDSPPGTVGLGSDLGWQHVAVVADGSQLHLYHNGREVSAGTRGTDPVPTPVAYSGTTKALNAGLGLGDAAAVAKPSDAFRGYLDEVAVWKVPLTAEQVASHYTAEDAGYGLARKEGAQGLAWNSAAIRERPEDDDGTDSDLFDITAARSMLKPGANLLAIQGLNVRSDDRDFLIAPLLQAGRWELQPDQTGYLEAATPAAVNGIALQQVTEVVGFSAVRGYYDQPLQLQLTTAVPELQIRYTLDGSVPTDKNGLIYSGAIRVDRTSTVRAAAFRPGFRPGPVTAHTYVFLDQVLTQKNQAPAGSHWDTEMDPEVVNQANQTYSVREGLVSLPTLSISMAGSDLFGRDGIYTNSEQRGERWVRSGAVELFYPKEYTGYRVGEGFETTAGVRIAGIFSRLTSNPKHSLRLSFRSEFGPSKLDFPLFEGSPVTRFDNLVVLNGHNQSWATGIANALYLRDQVSRDLQGLQPDSVRTHGTYVNLYLNGLYWGQYNLTERPDDSFASENFGGEKEDYDVLKGVRFGETPQAQLVSGTRDAWAALFALAAKDLTVPANYRALEQYVDIDQLIDYNIGILYTGDRDGPTGIVAGQTTPKNFYALRHRSPDGRFRFFNWDAEFTFEELATDVSERRGSENPGLLHARLRTNAEYRLRFADRVQKWFFEAARLSPTKVAEQFRARAQQIDRSIVAESARWGDSKQSRPFTRDVDWTRELDRVLTRIVPGRSDLVVQQFRADGLFPDVIAPQYQVQGKPLHEGALPYDEAIGVSAPTGSIYYTLDGTDPRASDEAVASVAPGALLYTQPIRLLRSVQIKARVLSDGIWSPLSEANFNVAVPGLQVTEIMYHPQPPGEGTPFTSNDFEFLELANLGSHPIHLKTLAFRNGIEFDFQSSTIASLGPGEYLVLASDRAAYLARYGSDTRLAGEYTGQLSNGGDRLGLFDRWGDAIRDFRYADDWYPETDGVGYSLTRVRPANATDDLGLAGSWRPSVLPGGSPAAADPIPGDWDGDGRLLAIDVDLLSGRVRAARYEAAYDVNRDRRLNEADHRHWVTALAMVSYGDANLDGRFDSRDLVQIFQQGEYEDLLPLNSGWAAGDWDGDGDFTTRDLVRAFQDGGYRAE